MATTVAGATLNPLAGGALSPAHAVTAINEIAKPVANNQVQGQRRCPNALDPVDGNALS